MLPGPVRGRGPAEWGGGDLLTEGEVEGVSYPVGSEIESGYPEFTMAMLKKLGWDADLTPEELAVIQKVGGDKIEAVKLAREVIRGLGVSEIRTSMRQEMYLQTFLNRSDDFAEFRAARAEEREPRYTGS